MEEMIYSDSAHDGTSLPSGVMISDNPHKYFIPAATDTPRDLRITLLGESRSPTAVHSSKVGG